MRAMKYSVLVFQTMFTPAKKKRSNWFNSVSNELKKTDVNASLTTMEQETTHDGSIFVNVTYSLQYVCIKRWDTGTYLEGQVQ